MASPPLVVAYALAGNTNIDLTTEPLGFDDNGQAVYLEEIMPSREEIEAYVDKYVTRQLFQDEYASVFSDSEKWNAIPTEQSQNYKWNQNSTYIQNPPYFDALGDDLSIKPLKDLKVFGLNSEIR